MAAPPVLPADFDATKVNANDNNCAVLTKLTQLSINAARLIRWMFNDDGSFTQDFLDAIGTGSTGLAAPTGLNATDDRTADITLTWAAVGGATSYSVYRGSTSDSASMSLVASGLSTTTYVDSGLEADKTFWYSVKAQNASQISALSASTDGKRVSSTSSGDPVYWDWEDSAHTLNFTIPSGKTTMEVMLWGGGGKGGHRNCEPWTPIGTPYPGGGGASGAFIRVASVTVAPGDVFVGVVGSSDKPTYLFKGAALSSVNAYANPGGSGKDMTTVAGIGGSSPSSYGASTLPGGVVDGVNSSVGNPGAGTDAGDAVSYGGFSAGAGGDGNQTCESTPGSNGRIRIVIT